MLKASNGKGLRKIKMYSKQKKTALVLFIAFLFIFPLGYLYIKTRHLKKVEHHQEKDVPANTAITALENLAKEKPTAENLINLSMAYINNNMPGKSIDYLKKAILLDSTNVVAFNNLGVAFTLLQQYQDGIEACKKALQLDPGFQLAKNNLAWATDEKNKVLDEIKKQENTPQDKLTVAFYINYGLNYFKIGEYDKSITIWKTVLKMEPQSTMALNNIGTALMMKGQYDEAILLFNKVIALDPTNELAKVNLAWGLDEKNKQVSTSH